MLRKENYFVCRRLLAKEGITTDSSEQTLSNTPTDTVNTLIDEPSTSASNIDSSTSDSIRQRRELAYMAATRRQQQGMSNT